MVDGGGGGGVGTGTIVDEGSDATEVVVVIPVVDRAPFCSVVVWEMLPADDFSTWAVDLRGI
jgi:hypothetical protein